MRSPRIARSPFALLVASSFLALLQAPMPAQGSKADYARADSLRRTLRGKVYRSRVEPHWFADNTCFWYRNDVRGKKEFVLVDTGRGERRPAFDHGRLAAALAKAAGKPVAPDRLPFQTITFSKDRGGLNFEALGFKWTCDLDTYACQRGEAAPERRQRGNARDARGRGRGGRGRGRGRGNRGRGNRGRGRGRGRGRRNLPTRSPDGKWFAFVRNHDLYLRTAAEQEETRLTTDGNEKLYYSRPNWSPDGKVLVAYRTTPGNVQNVYRFESSPRRQLRAVLHQRPYARPGDKFPSHEMLLFRPGTEKPTQVAVDPIDFRGPPRLRWKKDGRRFTYEKRDRGHQRARIIEVDTSTGKSRTLIDEQAKTFIDQYHKHTLRYVGDKEIIWASERDGWNHLYLYDAEKGELKNQITKGNWLVRRVDRVDEKTRQIWFQASGMYPDQDPYFIHHFRIGFDGSGLVALTRGNGNHSLRYSPDRKFYLDTYSRVDMPPVTELRRTSDGSLVTKLEAADVRDLLATGWQPPEVFTAKGRDGTTDIWGIIVRPTNFDPKKRYPVLEYIYAGPHSSHVPKTFSPSRGMNAMAELGFIVVQIDGMGTNNRSKAFHDVCWQNLGDAGFPDRILWIKEVARKYPFMDIERVGIYGTSAGGQNAMGGLLFHPKFYKVGVASCGCHDNRLDKASWNEQWMGYPVGPHYEKASNITNAHKLEGKLMLILGEMDTNVPPESTYRVVDALIKADKDFDFVLVPGAGHGGGGRYGERRRRDFFVRHLLGKEPRWVPEQPSENRRVRR